MTEASSKHEGVQIIRKILIGKYEGNRPLTRPRRRWKSTPLKFILKTSGFEGVEYINLTRIQ
jgi:hypothetical protein